MAQPYVKDGTITYDEFENIFSVLSLREKYKVIEILYNNGIDLLDKHIEEEALILDVEDSGDNDYLPNNTFEILYDESIFKDSKENTSGFDNLVVHRAVKQSNEVLCNLIQQGNRQAAQDLCIKNKRLVDKYVLAYEKRYGNRLDFEDLEQVGFIGLIKAAQKFNIQQETAFSTYAVFWIKQCIAREIMDNGYAIRIPVHMMERINKVIAADSRLATEGLLLHKRINQIASELDLTERTVQECLTLKKNYLSYSSLDSPIKEDDDSELGEFVVDENTESVETIAMNQALREELCKILTTLKPREREIIELRFGMNSKQPMTLEEVGARYNLTRERIRQIEVRALRKLRKLYKSNGIHAFLEE